MPLRIGQPLDRGYDQPLGLLSDCHRRIEHFLLVLSTAAASAGSTPLSAARRADLEAAVTYFSTAAPTHTADEEESLFPRLRQTADPAAAAALETVAELEHDHHIAAEHHGAVDEMVRRWLERNVLEPGEARALREHLSALCALYERHISIEDREVFPAAARLLSPEEIAQIGVEMAGRRSRRP
jgi:hemerythrin-like domain-containing protein